MRAGFPLVQEHGPSRLGFAHERDVHQRFEIRFFHCHPRAPHDHETISSTQFGQNFFHAKSLDAHSRHCHDVEFCERIKVDGLDVFIDERHVVLGWRECGEQGKARHRHVRTITHHFLSMFQPPVRNFKGRIYDRDGGHAW